ncbi:MAG: hypothetical protein AMJ46_13060 [Latescibacteria bacterium DG_63]|nr:MAG: hypothetical protein AMJ46_13060 [Latescibacteria bacterium DG_63]
MSRNGRPLVSTFFLVGLAVTATCCYTSGEHSIRPVPAGVHAGASADTARGPWTISEDVWEPSGLKVDFPCPYATENHGYFPEKPEFWFSIRGPKPTISRPGSPWTASGVYQGFAERTAGNFSFYDYYFDSPVVGRACTLSVSPQTAEALNLTLGASYDLVSYSHGLVILGGDGMLFHGHTDFHVDQTCVPANVSPVSFTQTRVLEDHYRTCIEGWPKFTNTEITFRLYGHSVVLYQGQTRRVAGYDIKVLVARAIEYPKCCDCGMCAISFMITKSERHRR